MKRFFENNKILILVFSILLLWGFYSVFQYVDYWNGRINNYERAMLNCETIYLDNDEFEKYCNDITEENYPKPPDTVTLLFDIVCNYSTRFLQVIGILFVIPVALWKFHNELKSGFIKNLLTRVEYKKYIIKSLINSWKYAFILPIFLIIMFFISYLISGHFDIIGTIEREPGYLFIDAKYVKILPQFLFVYLLNIFLHSIFWINLCYIITKKSRNIIVTIISTFIAFIMVFIVFEVLIGTFLIPLIFGRSIAIEVINYLQFSNIWVYYDIGNLWYTIIFSLFLIITSLLFVIKTYKNKEEVIIENEN